MTAPLFSRRALGWIVGLCAGSLLCASIIAVFRDSITSVSSFGPDSFSHSAIGHGGLYSLLRALDVPVVRSLDASGEKAGRHGVLVVAEPRRRWGDESFAERWEQLYGSAFNILIVLPKRTGAPDPSRPAWLSASSLVPEGEVAALLQDLEMAAEVVRVPPGEPVAWGELPGGLRPDLTAPQLLRSTALVPLWTSEQGMLLARWQPNPGIDELIFVLSDPDLIANHGLGRGQNAVLAVRLLESLGAGRAGVVIDETLHGYHVPRSPWRAFLAFPLSLIVVQALLVVAVLSWQGAGRFGAPEPAAPVHAPGQRFLIDNTAELLLYGRYDGYILNRYLEATVQDVARALREDLRADASATRRRLGQIGARRRVSVDLESVAASADRLFRDRKARRSLLIEAASDLHRWRQEMTHGL